MALLDQYYAVIEAGGTKFNCAIVDAARHIVEEIRIPTTTPEETLAACVSFFEAQRARGYHFSKMGIAGEKVSKSKKNSGYDSEFKNVEILLRSI